MRLEQIIRGLQEAYQGINDFQADFTQTVQYKEFETLGVSSGKMFFSKGKMRWDYKEPTQRQIFVNGEEAIYFTPEHQQAIRKNLGGKAGGPLQLLFDTDRLDRNFHIALEKELPKNAFLLQITPKEKGVPAPKILATVAPFQRVKGFMIQEVVLYEENGNISSFLFNKIKVNKGFDPDFFVFHRPEGIELIEAP